MGLLSIASYVKQISPPIDIEILDGRRIPNKDIGKRLDADVIGFGPSVTSYLPAIRMAEEVKNRSPSSLIVFGGPYVTPIAEAVLANRPSIDAVVVHDGEEALDGIVRNRGLSAEIPNLVYRNSSGRTVIKTPRKELNLKETPFPDVTLLSDMEKYWQDFWKTYPVYHGKKIISTAAQRGCPYRAGKAGGCFFCSRSDKKYRVADPHAYAQYILNLQTNYGVDIIEESSDDFAGNVGWLKKFVHAYEALGLNVAYRIFGRADNITEESVNLLKRINTESVLIGYESGDEEMLRGCNKGFSLETSLRATELLSSEGIDIIGAFILGFVGENEKSIDNTINFAEKVHKMGVDTISYSVLTPLPPSRAWEYMVGRKKEISNSRKKHGLEGVPRYFNSDILDPRELQRDFVNAFCEVDYDFVTEKLKELGKIGKHETGEFIPE